MASPITDWNDDVRSQASGLISLVVATVLSFGAGIGSTLLYLQANKEEASVVVPLIEAERGPTRVRPEGLDANGNPVARSIPSFSATSSALAMTPRGDDVPSPVPAEEPALNLQAQGIPSAPDAAAPNDARVVAELTPEAVTAPLTASTASPTGGPQFRLQLASFRSSDAAGEEMKRVSRTFSSELSRLTLSVERIDQGQRGIYFRVLSEPIAERDRAGEMCAALAGRRAQCMVVATQSRPAPPTVAVAAAVPERKPPEKSAEAGQTAKVAAADARPMAQPPAAVTPSPAVRAQLGSMRSLEGATRELNRLSRIFASELSATELTVSRIDQGERGVFYRILTGPFPDRASAGDLCHKLETNQAGCVLIQPRPKDA